VSRPALRQMVCSGPHCALWLRYISIGSVRSRGRIKRLAVGIVSDEYLDLYLLCLVALVFTVLGFVGVVRSAALASVTLALLALLAFSQIRSRRHVADIARAQYSDPLSIFRTKFPDDLDNRRASASSLLLIGTTMSWAVRNRSLRQMLRSGGKIRILLLDPTDEGLVRVTSKHMPHGMSEERLRQRLVTTLDELADLQAAGDIEIRVARFAPHTSISAIDTDRPDGLIVLQHYEHRPVEQSAPIFALRPADGPWYLHFVRDAERQWADGTPWPLTPAEAPRRSTRPLFKAEFGPELELGMSKAQELLITGVTRNVLITSKYNKFEDWLRNGCRIRILLTDPSSDAIVVAAERYYAERSADSSRERVRHTLRLLAELKRSTDGDLVVRLTSHPLAMGMISVNGSPDSRSETSALFVEYYPYQAPGEEPKFVLQPADNPWFENLYQEAEALWAGGRDYKFV
jgi:uncharacterized membrane protein YbaN (DUF454 family)